MMKTGVSPTVTAKEPRSQKTFQTKNATSIVAGVMGRPWGLMDVNEHILAFVDVQGTATGPMGVQWDGHGKAMVWP